MTGFLTAQPPARHCFLPCQRFQPAHARSAIVIIANMGRYGAIFIKSEAEPRPSMTTIRGPTQQAEASAPATTAPIMEVFSPFIPGFLSLLPPGSSVWDRGQGFPSARICQPDPEAHASYGTSFSCAHQSPAPWPLQGPSRSRNRYCQT